MGARDCHTTPVPDTKDLTELEAKRRYDATERLIDQMRVGGLKHTRWNRAYDQLAGRNPTEALADGDEIQVRERIVAWYRHSEEAAERRRRDPELVEWLRVSRSELASRHSA